MALSFKYNKKEIYFVNEVVCSCLQIIDLKTSKKFINLKTPKKIITLKTQIRVKPFHYLLYCQYLMHSSALFIHNRLI